MKKLQFTITPYINSLCTEIAILIGKYEGLTLPAPKPELRKHVQIASIQSSLAIEGNTLSLLQVTDIINNKRVVGPKKDILEVKNAFKVYAKIPEYNPKDLNSLLNAHKFLMKDLIPDAGRLRQRNVGIGNQYEIIYHAPDFKVVPELMDNLFTVLNTEEELHPLILSSVFHYEFEFIHPFMDGNGRIGRLWQSVILYNYARIFEYIPVETIIKQRQMEYYEAIQKSTQEKESTEFIKFMLEVILQSTTQFTKGLRPSHQTTELRLSMAQEKFGSQLFRRKDYLDLHNDISPPTASNDLRFATENNILERQGENINTKYRFKI